MSKHRFQVGQRVVWQKVIVANELYYKPIKGTILYVAEDMVCVQLDGEPNPCWYPADKLESVNEQ